jgi:hypothetical protein
LRRLVSVYGLICMGYTAKRPVENVVLTTKGLQEINTQVLDGTT